SARRCATSVRNCWSRLRASIQTAAMAAARATASAIINQRRRRAGSRDVLGAVGGGEAVGAGEDAEASPWGADMVAMQKGDADASSIVAGLRVRSRRAPGRAVARRLECLVSPATRACCDKKLCRIVI